MGAVPTSWEKVSDWYDSLIGERGGYFHTHVIFPKTLELLSLAGSMQVLDLACGQGAFSRFLASHGQHVVGIDASRSLITKALHYPNDGVQYKVDDARELSTLNGQQFDRVVSILALQNIDPLHQLCSRVQSVLSAQGIFVGVVLHPCFRSPRITGWGEDEKRKLQFRRVDRYITPMKIPINMHPGKNNASLTWTYHRPLSEYVSILAKAGFTIDALEEWVSDRQSVGSHAKSENFARTEIPMFMAFRAIKH